MVDWVLADGARELFDPAVGAGAFFRAARAIEARGGTRPGPFALEPGAALEPRPVALTGVELDATALDRARDAGLRCRRKVLLALVRGGYR